MGSKLLDSYFEGSYLIINLASWEDAQTNQISYLYWLNYADFKEEEISFRIWLYDDVFFLIIVLTATQYFFVMW